MHRRGAATQQSEIEKIARAIATAVRNIGPDDVRTPSDTWNRLARAAYEVMARSDGEVEGCVSDEGLDLGIQNLLLSQENRRLRDQLERLQDALDWRADFEPDLVNKIRERADLSSIRELPHD